MRQRTVVFRTCTAALGLLAGAGALWGAFATAAPAVAPKAEKLRTIPDALADAGKFKSLLAAIRTAGLEDALKGSDRHIFFAPTDDAFAAAPAATLDALMKDPAKLKTILQNHLVAREAKAAMSLARLAQAGNLKTVGGAELAVAVQADVKGARTYTVNDAKILSNSPLDARNGVIYPIDKLLLPAEKTEK